MRRYTLAGLVLVIAVILISLYMIWPENPGLFGRPIVLRLGLDIQGGVRVLMRAEQSEGLDSEKMNEVKRVIDRRVNALGVAEPVVQVAGANRIIVELPGIQNRQQAIDLIQQTALLEFVDFSAVGGCTAPMPQAGQYILTDRQLQRRAAPQATPSASATAEATAAATSEAAATAEPTAAATEAAPAPTATATAEVTAEATVAATEAAPVATADAAPTAEATAEGTAAPTAATPEATPTAEATPATNVPGSRENPLNNPCTGAPFRTVMTGAGLQNATARIGGTGQNQYVVAFQLVAGNPEAQNFSNHTGANIGQPLAIVLDGEVISAPTIQARLTDGGEITGNFTLEQARQLAVQLQSGALPVSLSIESLENVGASLGAQSVAASVRAGALGIVAIFAFLLIYYRVGGLAAALALIVFGLINFALYKFIPVTLTLSAITGFLISIGSAIDGNILIFERIKEELRNGRTLAKAIDIGFSRAWTSIRDSNISTIIIALILYFFGGQFGASAVRGFSITLIMGLILNLFTVIIVTRVFLTLLVGFTGARSQSAKLFG